MISYDMPFSNFITAKCPKRKRKMLKTNICFFKYFTLQSGMIKYDMPFSTFYFVFCSFSIVQNGLEETYVFSFYVVFRTDYSGLVPYY